jgi:phage/plasmid primase-like uncharacterized protein
MVRILVGALIIAIIGGAAGYAVWQNGQNERAAQQKKIDDLQQQIQAMQQRDDQLRADLAKAQQEEERLSAANQQLSKILAQARLTGKIPELPPAALPYPPK